MLDTDLIRIQVLLLHEAGPLAENVIRKIAAEAERHAADSARKAERAPELPPEVIVTLIRNVRGDLEPLRSKS